MIAPPAAVIEHARVTAMLSPCAKSQRGAVIFDPMGFELPDLYRGIVAAGENRQPRPMVCYGSEACRSACSKLCIHAEQHALLNLPTWKLAPGVLPRLEMVHVKVVNSVVLPGGPPSCWQCSKLVLFSGIAAMWLYEGTEVDRTFGLAQWRRYTALAFHQTTLINSKLADPGRYEVGR